ncbi:MAG: PilZ domain-containing protein [Dissulfurispiraceae bacterium]|jgi:hypothetical protein
MGMIENHVNQSLPREQRIYPRLKCNYVTECSDNIGNQWACKIVDISERGLGAIMSASLRRGEIINITEPKTKAMVVWVEKGRKGRIGLLACL